MRDIRDLFNKDDGEKEERQEAIYQAIKKEYKAMGRIWQNLSVIADTNKDDLSDDDIIYLEEAIGKLDEAENEVKKLLRRARKI